MGKPIALSEGRSKVSLATKWQEIAVCCLVLCGLVVGAAVPEIGCQASKSYGGGRDFSLNIVGGNNTYVGEWPWQIVFYNSSNKMYFCGGSLISKDWILTAAHCFWKRSSSYSNLRACAGVHRLSQIDPMSNNCSKFADRPIIYMLYNDEKVDFDIALVKLANSTDLKNPNIDVVHLPGDGNVFKTGNKCYITGWGLLGGKSFEQPDILQEARVPLIDTNDCKRYYSKGQITSNMLCAGYEKGGVGACQGDSGGPLVCKSNGKWTLVGITSWGPNPCGSPRCPTVFTNVTVFTDWIKAVVKCSSGRYTPILVLLSICFAILVVFCILIFCFTLKKGNQRLQ